MAAVAVAVGIKLPKPTQFTLLDPAVPLTVTGKTELTVLPIQTSIADDGYDPDLMAQRVGSILEQSLYDTRDPFRPVWPDIQNIVTGKTVLKGKTRGMVGYNLEDGLDLLVGHMTSFVFNSGTMAKWWNGHLIEPQGNVAAGGPDVDVEWCKAQVGKQETT